MQRRRSAQGKEVNNNNKVSKYKSCSFGGLRVLRLLPARNTLPAAQQAGLRAIRAT